MTGCLDAKDRKDTFENTRNANINVKIVIRGATRIFLRRGLENEKIL